MPSIPLWIWLRRMPRRAPKKDDNHHAIVKIFIQLGAHCEDVSMKEEFCDVMVLYRKQVVMVEIKDGAKVLSKRKLTKGEIKFRDRWKANGGNWALVETEEDAINQLTGLSR